MTMTHDAPGELRTGNPALSDDFVTTQLVPVSASDRTMSVAGVSVKAIILLAFVIAGGSWGWASATEEVPAELGGGFADTTVTIPGGFWLASFGAFFLGIMMVMAPRRAALFGILYSVAQGFCLGAISAMFDDQTDGIVGAAILSTVCVFVASWVLYVTRIVKPTQKLVFAVSAGIGGLALLYFFVFVLSIFNWGWLYSESFRTVGVIVSVIAIVLAALSFVIDFGTIESGVRRGAPKELEWYMAFSLMLTLIWLYMTILRLLALLSRNR